MLPPTNAASVDEFGMILDVVPNAISILKYKVLYIVMMVIVTGMVVVCCGNMLITAIIPKYQASVCFTSKILTLIRRLPASFQELPDLQALFQRQRFTKSNLDWMHRGQRFLIFPDASKKQWLDFEEMCVVCMYLCTMYTYQYKNYIHIYNMTLSIYIYHLHIIHMYIHTLYRICATWSSQQTRIIFQVQVQMSVRTDPENPFPLQIQEL